MDVIIKFKGELFREVDVDRGFNDCIGCYWESDMSIKCPSEEDVWQCNKDSREDGKDSLVLVKYTLNNLLTDL